MILFYYFVVDVTQYNLALDKPVTLSSSRDPLSESHLVDGDRTSQSCVSTLRERRPWMYIDLQEDYPVYGVALTATQGTNILITTKGYIRYIQVTSHYNAQLFLYNP